MSGATIISIIVLIIAFIYIFGNHESSSSSSSSRTYSSYDRSSDSSGTNGSSNSKLYLLVGVVFPTSSKVYQYISDDPDVAVGDTADVYTNDGYKTVRVVEVRRCTAANAPYPIEKTKHISHFKKANPKPTRSYTYEEDEDMEDMEEAIRREEEEMERAHFAELYENGWSWDSYD